MIEKISDILIVTDIDGTLLREKDGISETNLEAIHRFTDKGGHFTVATGRPIDVARKLVGMVPINAPSVHINGGYFYDWKTSEILEPMYISSDAKYLCKKVVEKFPFCDCHFADTYAVNVPTSGEVLAKFIPADEIRHYDGSFESIHDKVFKFIISCDPDKMKDVRAYAESIAGRKIKVIQSSPFFLEILPFSNSKAESVKKLCAMMGFPVENLVTVGDFENDIEMIKAAGIGCAVDNALQEVKDAADIVLPSCEDNGIAGLIDFLFEMYG